MKKPPEQQNDDEPRQWVETFIWRRVQRQSAFTGRLDEWEVEHVHG